MDLTANTYPNYSSMEICQTVKFTKRTNKAQQMDAQMITVNNFFEHLRRYPDDKRILPTNNSVDIYQYSNAQLKYLHKKLVKTLLKTMLYSNKPVYLDKDVDRRPNNEDDDDIHSDPNLTYQIKELKDYLFQKYVYRIPLGLIVNLGLVNFAIKTDTKILLTLERQMNKSF